MPFLALAPLGPAATLEEARERGELQRTYYLLLSAVTSNAMSGALLKVPPGALEAAVVGLTRGAATHVDPTVRRTCLQVRGWEGQEEGCRGVGRRGGEGACVQVNWLG